MPAFLKNSGTDAKPHISWKTYFNFRHMPQVLFFNTCGSDLSPSWDVCVRSICVKYEDLLRFTAVFFLFYQLIKDESFPFPHRAKNHFLKIMFLAYRLHWTVYSSGLIATLISSGLTVWINWFVCTIKTQQKPTWRAPRTDPSVDGVFTTSVDNYMMHIPE